MAEALRLNLIQLPEGSKDEEALAEIVKPFADQILRKHTPFLWQAARSGPVQYMAGVMIVLPVLAVLIYTYRRCATKREKNARNIFGRRRRDGSDDYNWCGMRRKDERVPPPRYDTPYKKSGSRPASYPQVSMGDDSFSKQIYLLPRIPETPMFDETSTSRITEASGSKNTPLMGRGMSYVRKKWGMPPTTGPKVGRVITVKDTSVLGGVYL